MGIGSSKVIKPGTFNHLKISVFTKKILENDYSMIKMVYGDNWDHYSDDCRKVMYKYHTDESYEASKLMMVYIYQYGWNQFILNFK